MQIPLDTPAEVRQIIESLCAEDDLGAFWISDDYSRVTINMYIDGMISAQTFILNEATGYYDMVAYNGLARAKTDGG